MQSPEQRFEIYWEQERKKWHFDNLYSSNVEDKEIEEHIKRGAKDAFLFAIGHCGRIAEAFWNNYRFQDGGSEAIEIWQTILGNHPDKRVKIGDLK